METINIEEIKVKTTRNLFFLTIRNLGVQAISMLGFFILTIILGAAEVGLFAIVAESVAILGYFSDVGLAAALIQKKDKVTKTDLRTTFVVQQILVLSLLTIVAIGYPAISQQRNYGDKEMWILISLCFSFFAASLKTIPSVLLERGLNFKLLSTIDIIENASFYLIAVVFAFRGFGAYSYAFATFFRSMLGLALIYRYSPWPIGISFSLSTAKSLFSYGIPFQLNSFIAVAKDRLSNLFVAGIVGRESFAFLTWAQKGPRVPLSLMDAIMKVTFPTFSRLQDQKEILKKSLEKSIYFIALIIFPALIGISFIAPDIVAIIPKYTKWAPALLPLYIFSLNAGIAAITTPITNAFNAVGKITLTTRFMIMWTLLTWLFYPALSYSYGYVGTAVASLIVGISSFVVWFYAQKEFGLNVFKTIFHPFAATFILGISLSLVSQMSLDPIASLYVKIILGVMVFAAYNYFFAFDQFQWFLKQLKNIKQ